ncbi:MAG: hypothetical protein ABIH21_03640 [Patescibacteria group bacterium]
MDIEDEILNTVLKTQSDVKELKEKMGKVENMQIRIGNITNKSIMYDK